MNAVDRWIYLDGAEPEELRGLLEVMRDLDPAGREEMDRLERETLARLDAEAEADPSLRGEEQEEEEEEGVETQEGWFWEAVGEPREGSAAEAVGGEPVREVEPEEPAPRSEAVEEPGPEAAPEQEPGEVVVPSVVSVPAALKVTGPAFELSEEALARMGKLPFVAPEEVPAKQRSPRTVQSVAYRARIGETARDDGSLWRAVQSLPFAGSTVAAGRVSFPDLTVLQYASLCAELAVAPGRTAGVLGEYRVPSKAAHAALDAHWIERMGREPETGAEFQERLAMYVAYLREKRM